MKRVDTDATDFSSIEWGQDILDMVEYEEPVYAGELVDDAEQGVINLSASQTSAFESSRILTKGSGVNRVQTYDWGRKEGVQEGQDRNDGRISNRRKYGKEERKSSRTSENNQNISLRVQPSRTIKKRGKYIPC
ncbi:MAG: hypothetical protein PVF83_15090 [Anaerolineales bacterium]|jgi:hypothetical protein